MSVSTKLIDEAPRLSSPNERVVSSLTVAFVACPQMIPLPTFTTNIFNINILKKEHVDCTGDGAPDRFDV